MSRKRWVKVILLCSVLSALASVSLSSFGVAETVQPPLLQVNGDIVPPPLHSQSAQPKKQAPLKPVQPAENKQIWNLKDADIRAVIQTISLLTGKTFLVDPSVRGKVTLVSHQPMTPQEIYQVFLSMLQVLNFSAVPSGNLIKIVPSMTAKEYGGTLASSYRPGKGDEVVVRVVPIYNVSAAQMMPVLRPLLKEWGSVNAYIPSNSLILAGTAENVKRLVAIVHKLDRRNAASISVVRLRYANADKIVSIIKSLQEEDQAQGKVSNVALSADDENNSILISGNLESQYRMRLLIRRLDTKGANGSGNTRVVHLNYLDAKKLAPILTKIAVGTLQETQKGKGGKAVSQSSSGISVQAEDSDNAIIIHAPQSMIRSLVQVIRQLDVRPGEVLVEAIIVEIDEGLLNKLGVIWSTSGQDANTIDLRVNHGVGFLPDGNLSALLHVLLSNESADVLSTPSIVVLNNKPAKILDGKNVGIINRQYATNAVGSNNEATIYNTIQRKDVALSLDVTPQISPNKMLRLKIKQQDDTIDNEADTTEDNPTFDTNSIETNVIVHSGDILVLGGLISHNQRTSVAKVPILGDIPILGNLFRFKSHQIEKKELMVFIRPIIMNTNYEVRKQTLRRYNYIRHQEIEAKSGRRISNEDLAILPELKRYHLVRLPPPIVTEHHGRK